MYKLSFFNWSIKKTLAHVLDALERAKIKVFFIVFLLNYPKIIIGVTDHLISGNTAMLRGDAIALVVTTVVIKLLLSKPNLVNVLIHIALFAVTFHVFKALFFYQIDIPAMQQIFMAIAFSFYGLGRRWGIFYTSIMVAFVATSILFVHHQENIIIVSTRYENGWFAAAIIILNFIAIAISHFYFHSALYNSLDKIKSLNERLQSTVKAKSDFLSTMSHELRTPLNSVIGMANIMAIGGGSKKEQEDNLEILKFSAETMLSLINNILDFNKMDSVNIELESIPIQLDRLMRSACAGFEKLAISKGLNFKLSIDPVINDFQVLGDPTRLIQIMFNLIGNAIKFTKKGYISVKIDLLQRDIEGKVLIRFSVVDTGVGIAPAELKMIFEPFVQASKSTTRNFGGTGLGLSIVKYLLEIMGSKVVVKSIVGGGTHFYFDVEYATTSTKYNENSEQSLDDSIALAPLKVLVAEDNPMNILFMKKLFASWNINIVIAENGKEAVTLIQENDFDVVLMDLHMPVMDGYQAVKIVRKMKDSVKSQLHIIALTASSAEEVLDKAQAHEFNDFLSKPFNPNDLKNKLHTYSLHLSKKSPDAGKV